MKHVVSSLLILLFSITAWAQTEYFSYEKYNGDSVKIALIQEPTVCDCIDINWRNKPQEKICNLTYDYDFMSKEEQEEYDKQSRICQNPSICDCANASSLDKGLIKACNNYYNYKGISKSELENYISALEKCPKKEKEGITICECLNVDDYQLKQKCNDTFFSDSLVSEAQRKINLDALKKCISDKDYNLTISACDCALNSESDPEFKKICDERIEKLKTNKKELTDYFYTLKACKEDALLREYITNKRLPKSDLKYTVCRCNEDSLEKEVSEKCNNIWKFKEMTPKEQQAFINVVARCY